MNDLILKTYVKLSIKKSQVSGYGLFAEENINAGQLILSFGGSFSLQKDRYSNDIIRSTCIGLSEDVMLCEKSDSAKDISDYINHSCDPNVGMYDSITLVAIKPISQGDEIVCDYAFWEGDDNWIMKNECFCCSIKCRKRINGSYWKQIKSSYTEFEFFSPFIKRKILKYENKD